MKAKNADVICGPPREQRDAAMKSRPPESATPLWRREKSVLPPQLRSIHTSRMKVIISRRSNLEPFSREDNHSQRKLQSFPRESLL